MKSRLIAVFTISILCVLGLSLSISASESSIPDWVKNNAKWWSEGSISESDYITSLEYLIQNGIIDLPTPITKVTAAQTMYSDEERAQSFRVTISNIIEPLPVHFFEKFELSSSTVDADDPLARLYEFHDTNPGFFLESLPSVDKQPFYDFVADWMDSGDSLNEFDVDVDVLDGTGAVIQTWGFEKCGITSYGTYLQEFVFVYSYSGLQDSEIRDKTTFSCVGVHLETP